MAGAGAGGATPPNAVKAISAARFPENPLITPESGRSVGENINGPSVIRVPKWIEDPLGRYYMYFASHSGDSIRLAYADSMQGPWRVHDPGTLRLDQARPFRTARPAHIASPDAHVDEAREEIRMYFHGMPEQGGGQATGVAISKDGIAFEPLDRILGRPYFRVFRWKGACYALAKQGNDGWGTLSRSPDGLSRFDERRCFVKDMRHAAVMLRGDILLVFHSRVGDAPERIVLSTVRLSGDWTDWAGGPPHAPTTARTGRSWPA